MKCTLVGLSCCCGLQRHEVKLSRTVPTLAAAGGWRRREVQKLVDTIQPSHISLSSIVRITQACADKAESPLFRTPEQWRRKSFVAAALTQAPREAEGPARRREWQPSQVCLVN